MEFWASAEPTIARISADQYRDQRVETGHYARLSDIDRLATLGISATRYPVLWESVAPCEPNDRSYVWEDERMRRLARFGIEPIVTLLHHGSGPAYTSLIDDAFPELFADYAEATARRYSHVRRWTPINEPLTTARFSTLYGAWYPNARNDRAFGAAIVNQMLGYLLAVERIRSVRPDAEFLLTEDLQRFVGTDARARAYADHKQERAYLSIDLARGVVDSRHPLWAYLTVTCAVAVTTLERIRRHARPPDMLGWNYYPNSERYLATQSDGTMGNIPLLDALPVQLDPKPMLREAWRRFGIPLALSEVHVMGTHAERARWLVQRHDDAITLQTEQVDLRAFGAWAAFGMVDWTSLLCERRACLEDGLFTCEPDGAREPALTLAGETFRQLAQGTTPALRHAGWWERRHSA